MDKTMRYFVYCLLGIAILFSATFCWRFVFVAEQPRKIQFVVTYIPCSAREDMVNAILRAGGRITDMRSREFSYTVVIEAEPSMIDDGIRSSRANSVVNDMLNDLEDAVPKTADEKE